MNYTVFSEYGISEAEDHRLAFRVIYDLWRDASHGKTWENQPSLPMYMRVGHEFANELNARNEFGQTAKQMLQTFFPAMQFIVDTDSKFLRCLSWA